ncbi:hypothetical protein [Streptococcus pantholopis]|uniref:Uncharacterized protein n=1 Tax=Streptococcus pantholopis TaxID=1811193 RepID=A0A172Q6G0_9STRE|nr:hypothetical protein [Streptococcus pantholopis]AND79046.1 hypothetical protein A0O21_02915 [Streptococcus pantholopis]
MEIRLGLVILIFYLLLCLGFYLFIRKKFAFPAYYIIFICGLPLIGLLLIGITAATRQAASGRIDIDSDEDDIKQEGPSDRELIPNDEKDSKNLISLEEALLLKNSDLARDILLDIIGENPEEFLDLFYLARLNEDAEVVHYATTVIAELSRQYDLKMAQMEKAHAKEPNNLEILAEYCNLMDAYIKNAFVTGQMAHSLRTDLISLLEKKIRLKESLVDYANLVEHLLSVQNYDRAQTYIDYMMQSWPENENPWLLQLQLFLGLQQGDEAVALAQKMKEKNIYISAENREIVDFWQVA